MYREYSKYFKRKNWLRKKAEKEFGKHYKDLTVFERNKLKEMLPYHREK